jgi:putative endonuclease
MPNTKDIGDMAEDIAVEFLERHGWRILDRKWKYKQLGELDIVADDGEYCVFVEVRYRRTTSYGLPEETCSPAKIRRLRNTAKMWLLLHGISNAPCRFDLIGMDLMLGDVEIRHYRNVW